MPRNFVLLRFVAAQMVVVGHSYELQGLPSPVLLDANLAAFAVRVFFVISGYLVCESWSRDPNLARYFLRRALRIFPALAVVVLVTTFAAGPALSALPAAAYFADPRPYLYLKNLLLAPTFALPGVFGGNLFAGVVNGSLWTLPAEFMMYLLLPLLGRGGAAAGLRAGALAVAAFALGGWLSVRPDVVEPVLWQTSLPQVARWAPYFLAGAVVRALRLERCLDLHVAVLLGVLLCLPAPPQLWVVLVSVWVPYLVLSFCLRPGQCVGRLAMRADLSYGIYLTAFPVQQAVLSLHPGGISPLALTAICEPFCLAAAALSWFLVERPLLRLKPRRSPVHASLDTAPGSVVCGLGTSSGKGTTKHATEASRWAR